VLKQQAGLLVGHLIGMTPPGNIIGGTLNDAGGLTKASHDAGRFAIAGDIAALFPVSNLSEKRIQGMTDAGFEWGTGRGKKIVRQTAFTEAEMERLHKAARSPLNGRVRTGARGVNMAVTKAKVRAAYIRKAQENVGLLAAGWLAAAAEMNSKARIPAWVKKHGRQPGGATESRQRGGVTITLYNNQFWFPRDMARRVGYALARRERGLRKELEILMEKAAAKAQAKMK
jgi:hypothetical protein